jgi:hypothetical protein
VARDAGVDDRVKFEVAKADGYPRNDYDLICFFDCLHDMGRPVDAARHAANAMADDGTVMLVEPFAGDRVEDNINPIGRLYYAASTTLCCAHAISEKGTHVLGAQAGPRQLEEVLRSAGLGSVRRAAQTIQSDHRGASLISSPSWAGQALRMPSSTEADFRLCATPGRPRPPRSTAAFLEQADLRAPSQLLNLLLQLHVGQQTSA